jgi:effector-binding domain-containing protein
LYTIGEFSKITGLTYHQLPRSYGRIFDYIKEKKLKAVAPIREIYLKGPGMIFKGNPKNYLIIPKEQ